MGSLCIAKFGFVQTISSQQPHLARLQGEQRSKGDVWAAIRQFD
jgi:hypothetical protein